MELFGLIFAILVTLIYVDVTKDYGRYTETKTKVAHFAVFVTLWVLWVSSVLLHDVFVTTTVHMEHDVITYGDVTYSTPKDVKVTTTVYPWWSILGDVEKAEVTHR